MTDLSRLADQAAARTTAFVAARRAELDATECPADRTPDQVLAELADALDRELGPCVTAAAE